jgi:hypothetical protein
MPETQSIFDPNILDTRLIFLRSDACYREETRHVGDAWENAFHAYSRRIRHILSHHLKIGSFYLACFQLLRADIIKATERFDERSGDSPVCCE